MQLAGDGAELWLEVSDEVRPLITDRSVAIIGAISLLGEGAIDISPAAAGTSIPEWGYVPSGEAPNSIAAAVGLGRHRPGRDQPAARRHLRAGKGTIGQAASPTTPPTANRSPGAGRRPASPTPSIAAAAASAGWCNDPAVYNELAAATANLNAITASIKRGRGQPRRRCSTIRRWPARCRPRPPTSKGIAGRLAKGEGTAGKLLTDEALFARLSALTTRLDDLSLGLQSGRGTAGRLLQDDVLYDNMNASVAELRQLVSDIRKDPKKYLNVKVSLF